jgi:hypothetical protein
LDDFENLIDFVIRAFGIKRHQNLNVSVLTTVTDDKAVIVPLIGN